MGLIAQVAALTGSVACNNEHYLEHSTFNNKQKQLVCCRPVAAGLMDPVFICMRGVGIYMFELSNVHS